MPIDTQDNNPAILSYHELRQAVGCIAIFLPLALYIPWWFICRNEMPASISGYYHTGMRNLFEGAICSIGLINLLCKGYDYRDQIAGMLAGLFAFGVAFCPTTSDFRPSTPWEATIGHVHLTFAILLFLTLTYMCLFLFRLKAKNRSMTIQKVHRNHVYAACGIVMFISDVLILLYTKFLNRTLLTGRSGSLIVFETLVLFTFGCIWVVDAQYTRGNKNRSRIYYISAFILGSIILLLVLAKKLDYTLCIGPLGSMFFFETTALVAFGAAWLVKGEAILQDREKHAQP
jgi:membrane protein CcdC involved in cytochrome C biogenesis